MTAARLLLVPYLVVLGLFVFTPGDDAQPVGSALVIAAELVAALGVPFDAAYTVIEFGANIALFVPLGLLLVLAVRGMPVWGAALIGALTTCVIEVVQLAIPGRFSTLSDVIANTLGTVLGAAIAWAALRRRSRAGAIRPDRSRTA
ncbi:VanZ family protein [Agromyces sp. CFH 90414]|uniref:VanZ family protein n=1 Tax=Agromyces agglutinans TaxID=2662258 RepID=A0A6I2F6S4_9MICO|nr:VanZ family protein [Agromyces agglutinans]MRG60442.1 VanZ family protein [Agromyces agglutinans]